MTKRGYVDRRTPEDARRYCANYYARHPDWKEKARARLVRLRARPGWREHHNAVRRAWWNNVHVPRREADREMWQIELQKVLDDHAAKRGNP